MPDGGLKDDAYRRSTLRRIEDNVLRLTDNEVEVFLLLNERGEPVFTKAGQHRLAVDGGIQHEVLFTPAELAPFVGASYLLTHNHPTDSSFTLDDVAVMAFLNVREGNAFRHDVRYRLIRLIDRWPSPQTLRDEFSDLDHEVELVLGTLVRARRLTPAQAAASHLHAVWTRFADRRPGEYAYVRERR